MRFFTSRKSISSLKSIFDHLLESSHRDDSKKWSNIGFGQEMKELALIEIILRILSGALHSSKPYSSCLH